MNGPLSAGDPRAPSAPRRAWLLGVIGLLTISGIVWTLSRHSSSAPTEVPIGTPTLLEFGMDICTQCKQTRAMLERLSPGYEGRLRVRFVDVRDDANDALVAKVGLRVIPLLVLFDAAGREVWRHEGVPDESTLLAKLDEVVARPSGASPAGCPPEGSCVP